MYLFFQLSKGKAWLFALWKFIRRFQFPTVYKMWFSINMIFILIFSIRSYAFSLSEDSAFGARLVCPLPAFAIIPASLVLDGYADTFQRLHEESACVLRSMPETLLHPYYSINHKIFSGSEQNIQEILLHRKKTEIT